jgi:hypothetical protein
LLLTHEQRACEISIGNLPIVLLSHDLTMAVTCRFQGQELG